jgi:hypothetical protein
MGQAPSHAELCPEFLRRARRVYARGATYYAAVIRHGAQLIGIRHEIEHQMTRRIDDQLSAKFQASALNFNDTIKKSLGKRYGLNSEQAFSIQCASISEGTARELMAQADLPRLPCVFVPLRMLF